MILHTFHLHWYPLVVLVIVDKWCISCWNIIAILCISCWNIVAIRSWNIIAILWIRYLSLMFPRLPCLLGHSFKSPFASLGRERSVASLYFSFLHGDCVYINLIRTRA